MSIYRIVFSCVRSALFLMIYFTCYVLVSSVLAELLSIVWDRIVIIPVEFVLAGVSMLVASVVIALGIVGDRRYGV